MRRRKRNLGCHPESLAWVNKKMAVLLLFNGYRVSVLEYGKKIFRDINGGDGCTTVLMYFMPLKCALKTVKMVNFMLCMFYHIL